MMSNKPKKKIDWGYIASILFFLAIGICFIIWIVTTLASDAPSDAKLETDYVPVSVTITDVDYYYAGKGEDLYNIYGEYVFEDYLYETKLGTIPKQYQKKERYYVGQVIDGYVQKSDPHNIWSKIKDLDQRSDKAEVYTVFMFAGLIILWVIFKVIKNKILSKKNIR